MDLVTLREQLVIPTRLGFITITDATPFITVAVEFDNSNYAIPPQRVPGRFQLLVYPKAPQSNGGSKWPKFGQDWIR